MKRTLAILLVALFVAGQAFGAVTESSNIWTRRSGIDAPGAPNIIYQQAKGARLDQAPQVCRIVRFGMQLIGAGGEGILSGEVVAWDTNSADGITVRRPTAADADHGNFAGVLVTNICTADNGVVDLGDENWGVICVGGRCIASMDVPVTAGQRLKMGTTYLGGFMPVSDDSASKDVGVVCLETAASEGKYHVYIEH